MEDNNDTSGISATVQCVQYLVSHHMKNKSAIRKNELLKTVFKGRVSGKNYNRIMEDVTKTLKNVFGFSLAFIKDDKQFIIVNTIQNITFPECIIKYKTSISISKYRVLLKPITCALIMHGKPISEGEMWSIVEKYCLQFNLDVNLAKTVIKKDLVNDEYLAYKETDATTVMYDPGKTSFWFSLGSRALIECDQMAVLNQISNLYNRPAKSFKRLYSMVNK